MNSESTQPDEDGEAPQAFEVNKEDIEGTPENQTPSSDSDHELPEDELSRKRAEIDRSVADGH